MPRNAWATWMVILAGAAVCAVVVGATYRISQGLSIAALRESTTHRMDIYAASLEAELKRFEYLPHVISLNEQVARMLRAPRDEDAAQAVSRYLQAVQRQSGATAVYVMDPRGLTLAASNWDQPASFVHKNFAYRPYFQDALHGQAGRFYGIGTVSLEAGYYFSHAVVDAAGVVGVVAVKLSLERLDRAWGHAGERVAVADRNGVIFLSSEPAWKYRTLKRLSAETQSHLEATRQYAKAGRLAPLGIKQRGLSGDEASIVDVEPIASGPSAQEGPAEFLVRDSRVPGTDWQLLVLSDLAPTRMAARVSASLAGVTLVLLAIVGLYVRQRRRFIVQTIAARAELERVNDELERKVAFRTEALSAANEHLQGEIAERRRAEQALRATLDDLVHTSRMAALGQMSAGITHELNQPLAAMATLSGNAIVFMKRGELDQAEASLAMIRRVTEHMGRITAQLKKFARKLPLELRPTPIATVVADALFLLEQSMHEQSMAVELRLDPPEIEALCDPNRLEQVVLNLVLNAIDAAGGGERPRVLIEAIEEDEWVVLSVHDNGPGVPEEVMSRVFEPFFSTKAQGMGLGLGLTISTDIVRNLGGSIRVSESKKLGGACFEVRLGLVVTEASHA